ncbi:MAG: hypothetical protein QW404_02435, partial [Candidatus Nanoarchaeia archaeon]
AKYLVGFYESPENEYWQASPGSVKGIKFISFKRGPGREMEAFGKHYVFELEADVSASYKAIATDKSILPISEEVKNFKIEVVYMLTDRGWMLKQKGEILYTNIQEWGVKKRTYEKLDQKFKSVPPIFHKGEFWWFKDLWHEQQPYRLVKVTSTEKIHLQGKPVVEITDEGYGNFKNIYYWNQEGGKYIGGHQKRKQDGVLIEMKEEQYKLIDFFRGESLYVGRTMETPSVKFLVEAFEPVEVSYKYTGHDLTLRGKTLCNLYSGFRIKKITEYKTKEGATDYFRVWFWYSPNIKQFVRATKAEKDGSFKDLIVLTGFNVKGINME